MSLGSNFGSLATLGVDLLDSTQVRSFGDYELLEEIARGGMGVVYRARQLSLGREVAVKMILAGELATTEAVQRFRNEAAAAARLDHPHIVSVYEIGEHETQHFFSMRLVLGRRNIAMWAKSPALSPARQATEIAAMMAKVARAVAFAHERGVLHRDLKPSNILVDDNDEPQVTDFGLAKLANADSALTHSVAMLGSPSYMAPEQAEGRHGDMTMATDVYGLGAVLYELLAGRAPFLGSSSLATARLVVEAPPPALPDVPRDLATICLKCLAKEPARRYATATALAEDLERYAAGQPIRARPVSTPEALWLWARRRPLVAALLGALVLAFVGGFAGVAWQWHRAARANAELRDSIAHLEWRHLVEALEAGDDVVGLTQLAQLLRADPHHPRAASLAISVLEQRDFATVAAPPLHHGAGFAVRAARLSPDGARIVTAGTDGTARLWTAATSAPLGTPMAHGGPVQWVEFSGDGARVVTASEDKMARLWDGATGAPLGPPLEHGGPVTMAAFHGATLATISTDGTARLWQPDGATQVLRLGAPGRALAWSADGARLFTASDAAIHAWSAEGGELFRMAGGASGLALSPDGSRLVAFSPKAVRLCDAATGADLGVKLEDAAGLDRIAWSPDGSRLAGALQNAGWARIWDAASGRALTPRLAHLYNCHCLVFSPDGRELFTGGADGVVRRWAAATGTATGAPLRTGKAVMGVEFSADGTHVLLVAHPWGPRSAPHEGEAQWWDLRPRGPQPWRFATGATTGGAAWSADGRRCASAAMNGVIAVHETAGSGRQLHAWKTRSWARGLRFLRDDRVLGVAETDGGFSLWSLETGERVLGPVETAPLETAHFFADGRRLVTGSRSGEVTVWSLDDGSVLARLAGHRAPVNGLAVSPDGRLVASAGEDGRCTVSDAATARPLFPSLQAADEIVSVQFSRDGRWIVTASHDRTARQWDARTGAPRGLPLAHEGEVVFAEYSPDDRRLLTADRAGHARLWDAATGAPLTPPLRHRTALRSATFSPDGGRFVTEDHEGLRLWETATGEPLTVRQPHRTVLGIGFHAQGLHALFSPDGSRVLHGAGTPDVLRWDFPPPPTPAPAWLPDLLEAITGRRTLHGGASALPVDWLTLREKLRALPGEDFYSHWAREFCGGAVGH